MNFETVKDITRCPHCQSANIMPNAANGYDLCCECGKVWERLPNTELYLRDGEMMPWDKPCDNCAFRGDSPERADPVAWKDLQDKLAAGHMFFCHKGVPFDIRNLKTARETPFEFPKKANGIGGYDTEKMRLCRGYLNAHIVPEMKRHAG